MTQKKSTEEGPRKRTLKYTEGLMGRAHKKDSEKEH